MRRLLLPAGCFALLCAVAPLHAQRLIQIGIGGGVSLPAADLRTGANTGWHVLATAALSTLMQPIGLRLDVAYNRFAVRNATTPSAGVNQSVGSATLNGTYRLPMTDSPLSPYLVSGLGAYRSECSGGLGCSTSTRYGWNVGLGTKLYVLGTRAFVETRYHRTGRAGGNVQFFPVTIGAMF
jgi:Outer membrane protein beta-barrel domain